jgi:hypothetical protein
MRACGPNPFTGSIVGWAAGAIVLVSAFAAPARAEGQPQAAAQASPTSTAVSVIVDQAKLVRVPDRTQTLIVGNPMIADATVQRNGLLVVTGKSFGVTNLIALDAAGKILAESTVRVQAASDSIVVVQRGLERETYSCAPRCLPSLHLGDSPAYFERVGSQATRRNSLAVGAASEARSDVSTMRSGADSPRRDGVAAEPQNENRPQ